MERQERETTNNKQHTREASGSAQKRCGHEHGKVLTPTTRPWSSTPTAACTVGEGSTVRCGSMKSRRAILSRKPTSESTTVLMNALLFMYLVHTDPHPLGSNPISTVISDCVGCVRVRGEGV